MIEANKGRVEIKGNASTLIGEYTLIKKYLIETLSKEYDEEEIEKMMYKAEMLLRLKEAGMSSEEIEEVLK